MAVMTLEYDTIIRPGLDAAITDALQNEVADVAIDSIEDFARANIYDVYSPMPLFEASRRFSFTDDDSYTATAILNELTIEETVHPQNLFGGTKHINDDLGDIVSQGVSAFFQPFPRPWMDEGLEAAVNNGTIETALTNGLSRQGF